MGGSPPGPKKSTYSFMLVNLSRNKTFAIADRMFFEKNCNLSACTYAGKN